MKLITYCKEKRQGIAMEPGINTLSTIKKLCHLDTISLSQLSENRGTQAQFQL